MTEYTRESGVYTSDGFTEEMRDELCLALGRVVLKWSSIEYYTSEIIQALVPVSGRITSILVAGMQLDAQWDSIDALLEVKGAEALRRKFKDCRGEIARLKTKRNAAVHAGWWPTNSESPGPIALDSRSRKARAAPGFVFHFEGGLPELTRLASEIERSAEELRAILYVI